LIALPKLSVAGVNMAAYVIVDVEVTDPVKFAEYGGQVPRTVEQYGGKYLVRGGAIQKIEGKWEPTRVVVIEFASVEQAKRWYDSEEYTGPKQLRREASNANLLIVEGV